MTSYCPSTATRLDSISLIAIDLRIWLSKRFEVIVPVLKKLSGPSIARLVDQIVQDIRVELPSNLDRNDIHPTPNTPNKVTIQGLESTNNSNQRLEIKAPS